MNAALLVLDASSDLSGHPRTIFVLIYTRDELEYQLQLQ